MKLPQKTKFVRHIVAAMLLIGTASSASAQNIPLNPNTASVQMFRWKWNDIARECTNWLGPQGFGAVQISPPAAHANLPQWYDIYQPVNLRDLRSDMGTEAELQAMINTCHAAKVRVYADVIVNHLAAGSGTATNGSTWNANSLTYPHFGPNDFNSYCDINKDVDYEPEPKGSRSNVLNCRLVGLPDLKTSSSYVRGELSNYINKLRDMGVDGVRLDAAKHVPATDIAAIVAGVNKTTVAGEQMWITQEVIPDGNVNRNEYLSSGTLNEFKYTYAIRDMFRGTNGSVLSEVRTYMGVPGSWGGTWQFLQSNQATVFVNNWDTERDPSQSLNASNFTGGTNDTNGTKRYDIANIFMLAWPYGHAQLHSGFRFTDGNAGPPWASPFDGNGNPLINQQWDFIHRWTNISNMVKFRSYTNGSGVENFTQGNNNQIAFTRGNKGWVAINNSGGAWDRTFQTDLAPGTYCNVVTGRLDPTTKQCTGSTVTVDGNRRVSVSVPANGGSVTPAIALQSDQLQDGGGGGCPVNVKFRVANANTVWGQNVYVAGNRAELGNWTPTSVNALGIEGSGANAPWSRTIVLQGGTTIQYKFMKSGGGVGNVWERNQPTGSGNREVTLTNVCNSNVTLDAGSFAF